MKWAPLAFVATFALHAPLFSQLVTYDFSNVATLAQGAVAGQNVENPVPGFELLLVKDGRPVFHQSFGLWTTGRVANCDSASKTLSGALILALTDQSNLPFSLQTRVSQYVPQFVGFKQSITIAQCFAHTSGLRQNNSAVSSTSLTLQEAALDVADDVLAALPGTEFSYGGTSMHVAGAVAEIVGGASWNTLFAQRIALPLGLAHTRFVLTTPTNPRIAGGAESTASEFATFMEMLRRGGMHGPTRVLSTAAVNAMFTRQSPVGIPIANTPSQSPYTDGADYGVGVWLDERDHAGNLLGAMAAGARGFSCWIDFDDGMVGCFATDLTQASGIQSFLYLLRRAAQDAIRHPIRCIADLDDGSGTGTPDLGVTVDDLLYFLHIFEQGSLDADVDDGTSSGTPDAGVTIDDLLYFILRFEQGC